MFATDRFRNLYTFMKAHNSFNKFLISMICSEGNVCQLNSKLHKYNELIDENKN